MLLVGLHSFAVVLKVTRSRLHTWRIYAAGSSGDSTFKMLRNLK
jgi:hypothetical protein